MGAYGWFAKLGSLLGVLVTRVWYCFRELPISEQTRETSSALTRRRTRGGNDKLTNTSCIYIYIYSINFVICVRGLYSYIYIHIVAYNGILHFSIVLTDIISYYSTTRRPCQLLEADCCFARFMNMDGLHITRNERTSSSTITRTARVSLSQAPTFQIPPSSTTLNLPCAR